MSVKRQRGRPSKLTSVVIGRLSAEVAQHNNIKVACLRAGVAERTFHGWQQAIREGRGNRLQRELIDSLEHARGDFEAEQIRNVKDAGKRGAWVAAAWLLERTIPERYAKRHFSQIAHADETAR